jgi:hypothetical protein
MGIRAELIARTEADLESVRGELTRLGDDDLARAALVEREAELADLLRDLEHGVPSPRLLARTAQIRTRAVA